VMNTAASSHVQWSRISMPATRPTRSPVASDKGEGEGRGAPWVAALFMVVVYGASPLPAGDAWLG
jgi:hypothetical protein